MSMVRVMMTIFTAMALTAFFGIIWYVTWPVTGQILDFSQDMTETLDVNTTGSGQGFTLLNFFGVVACPLLIVVTWIWAFMNCQRVDVRGEEV